MTNKLLTVSPSETIAELEASMQEFRIRHVPVVENKKLVGLVSHRDLLRANSSVFSDHEKERNDLIHSLTMRSIMQHEVLTVRPDDTLKEAAHLILEAKVGCVCVTYDDDTLVGILTETDFVRLAKWFLEKGDG